MEQIRLQVFDFRAELSRLTEAGEIENDTCGVPREVKRQCISMVDKIGEGSFGEVW